MQSFTKTAATVVLLSAVVAFGCNDDGLITLPDSRPVTEFHLQGGGSIDVLWVVDNSGSMKEEQTKLGDNFSQFIGFFDALDYDFNMAIVTTDMVDPSMSGRFQGNVRVMTEDTPNLHDVFRQTVNVGTGGDKREKGLEAARTALSEPLVSGYNAGFLRDDAFLAVVIVTDEDDGGSEDDRPPMPPVSDYVSFFSQLKGDPRLFSLSVIAGDVPNGCVSSAADAAPGYRYVEAVEATGGTIESICQEDFGPVLERLGTAISGYSDRYELARVPDEGTLTVAVDGMFLDPGPTTWSYLASENLVQFAPEAIPESCSEIQIDYWVPAAPGEHDHLTIVGEEGGQTCEALELGLSPEGHFALDGGAIASCALSSAGLRPTTGQLFGALAFLLAAAWLAGWQRRRLDPRGPKKQLTF